MAYIFEEYSFKNYLHKNCHRNWFTKIDNVYETGEGTGVTNSYIGKYVISLEDHLKDPGIARVGDRVARGASGLIATGSGYVTGVSLILAPFTGGASLIPAALGAANTALQTAVHVDASKEALKPGDVHFKFWVGKSEWVAKGVSPWYADGGRKVWDVLFDVNCWSNQVYEERYVQQLQTYVQERPPTPWSYYTG
jgi:hypothetical protein